MNKMKFVIASLVFLLMAFAANAQVKKPVVKKTTTTKRAPAKKTAVKPKTSVTKPAVVKPVAGTRIKITTDSGIIVVRLYDKTAKHRDNFAKLAGEHFYDSLIFHRVINGFMIQGGDPESKHAHAGIMLGGSDIGYTIPAEFDTTLYHKKGALAAARTNNPEKASSGCQFYIVQGKKYTDAELNSIEMQTGRKYSMIQRMMYKTVGGTPFLDWNYTVFGEVESGLEVIDKIASVPTAPGDRPLGDVRMKMELVK